MIFFNLFLRSSLIMVFGSAVVAFQGATTPKTSHRRPVSSFSTFYSSRDSNLRIRPRLHHRSVVSKLNLSDADTVEHSGEDSDVPALKRRLTKEFFSIGFPAFIQLAAEPLAALVDTAYLGRLGPDVLGGAGRYICMKSDGASQRSGSLFLTPRLNFEKRRGDLCPVCSLKTL